MKCPPAFPSPVQIGGDSKAAIVAQLAQNQIQLNDLAKQLFADPRFDVAAQPYFVQLIRVTVESLGFNEGATFAAIINAASARGYSLCPLEVAPHLRLQYTLQPEGAIGQPQTINRAPPGSLTIASPPPTDELHTPWGFYMRTISGVLWLRGYRSFSEHVWSPEDTLVFVLPDANGMHLPS
jgi:hypothetical protein